MKRTMKSEGRTRRARGGAAGAQNSRPQTGRSKKREREILDAAAEIFRRQGYADTSVQDVADAVGILKGSLYYYIDSKEDLLFRVLSEVHEDANEIIEEISASDAPPLERLAEYIRRHVEYNARNLSKIAVYYHDVGLLSPDRQAKILEQRKRYESLVRSLVEEAQARGEVDPNLSPPLVANAVFGTINWIYTWYRPRGPASPEYLGRMYADLLINGITGAKMPPLPDGARKSTRRTKRR